MTAASVYSRAVRSDSLAWKASLKVARLAALAARRTRATTGPLAMVTKLRTATVPTTLAPTASSRATQTLAQLTERTDAGMVKAIGAQTVVMMRMAPTVNVTRAIAAATRSSKVALTTAAIVVEKTVIWPSQAFLSLSPNVVPMAMPMAAYHRA